MSTKDHAESKTESRRAHTGVAPPFVQSRQQSLLLYISTKANVDELAAARAEKTWLNPDKLRIAGEEIPVSENLRSEAILP